MLIDTIEPLDQHFSSLMIHTEDFAFLILITAGDDFDDIVDLDFHSFLPFFESRIIEPKTHLVNSKFAVLKPVFDVNLTDSFDQFGNHGQNRQKDRLCRVCLLTENESLQKLFSSSLAMLIL